MDAKYALEIDLGKALQALRDSEGKVARLSAEDPRQSVSTLELKLHDARQEVVSRSFELSEAQKQLAAQQAETAEVRKQLETKTAELRKQLETATEVQQQHLEAQRRQIRQLTGEHDALQVLSVDDLGELLQTLVDSLKRAQCMHWRRREEQKEQHLCAVCFEAPREVVMRPCNHFIMCGACSNRVQGRCPQCRARIRELVRIYT